MIDKIPYFPLPRKSARIISKGLYPVASFLSWMVPSVDRDLGEVGSRYDGNEYIAGALLAFVTYFVSIVVLLLAVMQLGFGNVPDFSTRAILFANSLLIALSLFLYILLYPRWVASKKKMEIEKDLLFAARHLMIQTSAGVPLYDSIVSLSEGYDENLSYEMRGSEYGEVGREFSKIVLEVRSGKELSVALEEAAERSSSSNYRKVLWQLANANKTGARVGPVLKEEVDNLASQQLIMIRSYGSQLGTLALFYMLGCIIAPTMGVVMLAISASVLPSIPLNETTFTIILALLVMVQVFFVGLIKSRRPTVSL